MNPTLMIVAEMAAINWALILVAAMVDAQPWKPSGFKAAVGNVRTPPQPGSLAARTDRAAKNMLENLALFTALVLVAVVGGVADPRVELGARIFFWARIVYIPIYMLGVPVARTGVWAISVIGMGLILVAIVHAAPLAF